MGEKKYKTKTIKDKNNLLYLNAFLSFVAILISIWSVNVTIKNNNFMQNEVAPAFQIHTYTKNGKTVDELVNVKGFVNNLNFKRYDEITLILPGLSYVMTYRCTNELEEKATSNRWPYQSICRDNLGKRIVEKFAELKEDYNVEINHMSSSTYYEVIYQDYKNELHDEIYSKNGNNTLSLREDKSEDKNNEQNTNQQRLGSYSVSPFDLSDEFIEKDVRLVLQMLEEWQRIERIKQNYNS